MNQLHGVMQSADVVIGIGARFSLGNPAGESSTLVNINVENTELTRVQPNTIPLHGDAKATIEAMLPFLIKEGAGAPRPPEGPQVEGCGRHGPLDRHVGEVAQQERTSVPPVAP